MALVVKTRTYTTGDNLTAEYYNDDRDEIIAGVNSINDAQVASDAQIQESKILFSGSGHGHTGGSDGKLIDTGSLDVSGLTAGQFIRVNAGGTALESAEIPSATKSYAFYIAEDPLTVANDKSYNPRVSDDLTATKLSAVVKTAPTGAGLIVRVSTLGGTEIASVTIPAGNTYAETTTMVNPDLAEGTYLRVDVTQVGSTVAGAYCSATLDTATA